MQDLFFSRTARPMLIGANSAPYDDDESLFELKLDGERCLAYLDGTGTVLVNRRGLPVGTRLPELDGIHRQVSARCLLDGELITGTGAVRDFDDVKARLASRNLTEISLGARRHPVCLVVFDILYHGGRSVTENSLEERKALLAKTVADSERMALARTVDAAGKAFYGLVLQQGLEGVVGKKKQSLYYPGKRTKAWVKVKNTEEDDYVIVGYALAQHVAMLLLGQYTEAGALVYKGRVTLGLRTADFSAIRQVPHVPSTPFAHLPADAVKKGEDVIWLKPEAVCTVSYIRKMAKGLMRQPHYHRLRLDKAPRDAIATEAQT